MRHYRILKLRDPEWERWAVISLSLREDDTWDVINEFPVRSMAVDYVNEVMARNAELDRDARLSVSASAKDQGQGPAAPRTEAVGRRKSRS